MSQKNQSSSNDTSFSFANAAPAQAINDAPGSAESGGGGTVSYRGPESGASTRSLHGGQLSWFSYGEVPTDRRRQDLHALRGLRAAGQWRQRWPEPVGHGHAGG